MLAQQHHNKHNSQLTSGYCLLHDASRHLGDPRITLLGGRLSQIPPRRGNRVSEFYDGSCQMLSQQHHNKMLNATDFHPGGTNLEESEVDENEAICDELARYYASIN